MSKKKKELKRLAKNIWNCEQTFIENRQHTVISGYVIMDDTGYGGGYYETLKEAKKWLIKQKSFDAEKGIKRQYCIVRSTEVKEIVYVDDL